MYKWLMLMTITGLIYAQDYSSIFQQDLPKSLNNESSMLETQLKVNLEACERVNPLLAGYYLEYLVAKFDEKIENPDENFFSTFNKKLESERKKRNDFIDAAGAELLKYSQGEYNIYGVELINKLKTDAKIAEHSYHGQKLEENKLYYYALKLITKDSALKYTPEVNFASKYAQNLKSKVDHINRLSEKGDEVDKSMAQELERLLVSHLYIVKGSDIETGGIKTNKNLFELMRIAGNTKLSENISVFAVGTFYAFNNKISEVIETLVEYRGEMGSLTNEKTFDLTYSISLGLGMRVPIKEKKGTFSYLDICSGIIQGFKSEINEERVFTNDLPYGVDYSEYFYDSYDTDSYDLTENKEVSVSGYFIGFATPLFSQDRIIDIGLSLDVHYISYEYEQYYQRTLSKIFPTKTITVYDEHTSTINESSILFQPGAWASLRFLDFIELNVKYLAPAGMSTSLLIHYEL
ncbi:MAG: hypothetical protein SCALA702_11890 [Melioribacteraceae bacterium]|nr:MAG: hypothetical protein SCALA702_11890 [Melioribacteraceae bacterium]